MIRALPLLLPALALAACGGPGAASADAAPAQAAAAVAAPAGSDWTEVVNKSPAGGYVMGNPDAAVKLIEFGALSCSHCADFAQTGIEPLEDYVKTGTVSFEFRPFLLNGVDLAASQLAECVPPAAFFPTIEAVYAQQGEWFGGHVDELNTRMQALQSATPAQQSAAIAQVTGLDRLFASRGLSMPAQTQCLANGAAAEALAKNTQTATTEFDVTGTPTFIVNGDKLEMEAQPGLWEQVERAITRAGGRKA